MFALSYDHLTYGCFNVKLEKNPMRRTLERAFDLDIS